MYPFEKLPLGTISHNGEHRSRAHFRVFALAGVLHKVNNNTHKKNHNSNNNKKSITEFENINHKRVLMSSIIIKA